ncbi:MAG: M48 family metalloprotease [Acidobacteria bacterium]|nr:M48 family metalloprotease [Acidobacteriota bacterium]
MVFALIFALVGTAAADRTKLKPGWNIFSPEQDVEMGREVSAEAERELPILNNRQATAYVDALGKRLASHAPGERYPYRFKIVNDKAINAFALPGGYIYVNRGTIEAAQNEAQLAGVMAHEIAHVALRHGTNQVSKAYVAQVPLSILGGAIGGNSVGAILAQLGIGFAANSILLKYSRDAERQADLMGTQILMTPVTMLLRWWSSSRSFRPRVKAAQSNSSAAIRIRKTALRESSRRSSCSAVLEVARATTPLNSSR